MDGISVFITIIILIIVSFIGLIRSETMFGVFMCFILLTITSYMTIYLFNAG
jgi:hypothetical protein